MVDALPTRPAGRILPAAEAQAWQDGFALLHAAQQESERLRQDARSAYADDCARGYADGKARGEEEAATLVVETAIKVDRYLGTLQEEVIGLALDVVRRVLGDFDVGLLVAKAARQAVAEIRRGKYIRVTVHPDVAEEVRDELDIMMEGGGLGLTVELQLDSTLAEGACIVATDIAVLDASIDTQLDALKAAFTGKAEDDA
ncbi:type III secretion component, YOP proteins translocation protein L [Nitratireductor pacificus pht-3B]|uniref:Type 3 secretion system stator protein n=2 Tax=Nitratireductor TaxID=245876 RepID=K2M9L7_9HYPH|nr:type III secretion component, YOP proteins translocation protein L [Nitratireductor pacificus pht-3B]